MSQAMEEIETRAVSDAISERLLRQISTGVFKPGEPLPPQRKLASQLGVSLSSLRESLQALAAIGVVEIKHGRGTFVRAHPSDVLVKRLDWALLLQGDETRDLMEARRVLDVSVARYAAERATDVQVGDLQTLFEGMMDCWRARNAACLEAKDLELHLAIARSGGNALLFQLVQSLYAMAEQFIRLVPYTRRGLENHRRVLEAIVLHDPEAAAEAMRILLDETERLYRQQDEALIS